MCDCNKKKMNEIAVMSISKRDIEKKVNDLVYGSTLSFTSGIQSAASKQKVVDKMDKVGKNRISWSKARDNMVKELLPFVVDLYKKYLAPIIIRERAFISEVDRVVNRELNLRVSTLLKSELGQFKIGSPQHQFAVMHILIGALKHAKFNLQAKKVPILFKGAKFDSNLAGEEWASSVLKTIRGYEAIGVKIAKLAENDGVDIVSAIGFYVSMTIGRPIGEKIQNLVEYNLTLGDFIRENIRFKNGEVFLKKEYPELTTDLEESLYMFEAKHTKGGIYKGKIKINGSPVPIEVEMIGADNKTRSYLVKVIDIDNQYWSKLPNDGIIPIPARLFDGPGGGWVKVKTPSVFEDAFPGGLADKYSVADLAKKHGISVDEIKSQIAKGMKVEMEHTNDKKVAFEIAKDHIFEDPKYYDKLKTIENRVVEILKKK